MEVLSLEFEEKTCTVGLVAHQRKGLKMCITSVGTVIDLYRVKDMNVRSLLPGWECGKGPIGCSHPMILSGK